MRTLGKFGLFEYGIYISFYMRGGHKVLNHDRTLTFLEEYAIILLLHSEKKDERRRKHG